MKHILFKWQLWVILSLSACTHMPPETQNKIFRGTVKKTETGPEVYKKIGGLAHYKEWALVQNNGEPLDQMYRKYGLALTYVPSPSKWSGMHLFISGHWPVALNVEEGDIVDWKIGSRNPGDLNYVINVVCKNTDVECVADPQRGKKGESPPFVINEYRSIVGEWDVVSGKPRYYTFPIGTREK